MLANWTDQGARQVKESPKRVDTARRALTEMGGEFKSLYMTMGDYDLVKAALNEIGAEIYFDKVRIRPGKPIVFARRGETYFFGLPGNPVSTSVTFNVFVRPAIRKMQGATSPANELVSAQLSRIVKDSSSRRSYLPARLFIRSRM